MLALHIGNCPIAIFAVGATNLTPTTIHGLLEVTHPTPIIVIVALFLAIASAPSVVCIAARSLSRLCSIRSNRVTMLFV
jgi:hypothetical protein